MELLQSLLGFFVAIVILVGIHEFGHFYVARLCGVKVLRFCIGLGKPIWSYTDKTGTEFGFAPIPLGGYVKMLGENEDNIQPHEQHLSFNHKTVPQRIAILAAGPMANFILAGVIFWVVLFFNGSAGVAPIIGHVEEGSLAASAGLEVGQEIIAVDGVATTTRLDVLEQLFIRLGETGHLDISVTEQNSDVDYESEIVLDRWMEGEADPDPVVGLGMMFYYPPIVLGDVQTDGAGAEAGLQPEDVMLSINGQQAGYISDWIEVVQASAGKKISLIIERQGQELSVDVTPRATTLDDGTKVGLLGVALSAPWPPEMIRRQSFGLFESLLKGLEKTWNKSMFVLVSLQKLIVGEISTKNLSGPIGIAKVAGDYAEAGLLHYIEFLAFLSITLGVMNLLPIPILDGGHILFCFVEAIKGSPVSERIQSMAYSIGLMVLAGVMVTAFYYDILRII